MKLSSLFLHSLLIGSASICHAQVAAPANPPTTAPAERKATPLQLAADTVVTADISYVETADADPLQKLDLYAPRGAKNAPVVLFIHGGGWTRGDRSEVGAQPKLFIEAGVIFISVDYRLSPQVVHPAHVDDIAAAIGWTKKHIKEYGGDPDKIVVVGHSAGSHLAALVTTDPRPLAKQGLKLSDVRGTVTLDGSAFDIVERIEKAKENLAENCRRAFGTDPQQHADASPINHISGGAGIPPYLLVFVSKESLNQSQSQRFADKLNDAGGKAQTLLTEGEKTHFTLVNDLGTPADTAGKSIVSFVERVTK